MTFKKWLVKDTCGDFVQEGFCPGGILSRGILSRGILSGMINVFDLRQQER